MGDSQGLVLQVIESKLEADEDLAGTSRVLPLRPSVSVWDVLAVCEGGGEIGMLARGRTPHTFT